MTLRKLNTFFIVFCLLAAAAACDPGGGSGPAPLTVSSIDLNPSAPAAGSIVALSATLAGGTAGQAVTRSWTVSEGTLSQTPPDFALILRQTARGSSAASLTTTQSTVYWMAPATASVATVGVTVGESSKSRTVNFTDSPVTMAVTDGAAGTKVVTVAVNGIEDLYQAAFRVNFTSAWTPTSVVQGEFLGAPASTLFLGLTNQNGFVPVGITKKGTTPGNDGSGTLATITFAPNSGTSAFRETSALPFELGSVVLVSSTNVEIE